MRLNKLFMGLALGVTLTAGTASTAEAKAKPVVVTVDKADASTARKVDAAFKKGKAVTLKVRGSKKASKKLLIKLQKETAQTMRYGIHFSLGGTDVSLGNVFISYKNLGYKQSGSYGCYTFSKSTCNAYKYAFKFIKGNVDRAVKESTNDIDKRYAEYKAECKEETAENSYSAYVEDMTSTYAEMDDGGWYDTNEETHKFFEAFLDLYYKEAVGEAAKSSVDSLVADASSERVDEEVIEEILDTASRYTFKETKPMSFDEFFLKECGKEVVDFYNGGSLKMNFSSKTSLVAKAIYLGDSDDKNSFMVYGDNNGSGSSLDKPRKMEALVLSGSSDAFIFKSLVNKTAQGICEDYAWVNETILRYLGCESWMIRNTNVNVHHAVCMFVHDGVLMGIDNHIFVNKDFGKYLANTWGDRAGWDKEIKDALLVSGYKPADAAKLVKTGRL